MTAARQTVAGAYERIEAHEALCAERYRGINEKLSWVLGGLATLFFGLLGWMAVQLYALQPLRTQAPVQQQRVEAHAPPAINPATAASADQ